MRSVCLFLSCVLSVSIVYARLGENADQCSNRYGKPTQTRDAMFVPDGKAIFYRTDIFTVSTEYIPKSTNVNAIVFLKNERDEHDVPAEISDLQIEALLQANSQEKEWKKMADDQWERSDGASAIYGSTNHIFRILDPESVKAVVTKYMEKKKDEIKGF